MGPSYILKAATLQHHPMELGCRNNSTLQIFFQLNRRTGPNQALPAGVWHFGRASGVRGAVKWSHEPNSFCLIQNSPTWRMISFNKWLINIVNTSRWWQLKDFWSFHPRNLGKMNPFFEHIFRMGWNLKPPTSQIAVEVNGVCGLYVVGGIEMIPPTT